MNNQVPDQPHGEPEVLPERWTRQHFPAYMSDDEAMVRVETWNACLDEIAKLGPLYPRPVQGESVGPIGKIVAFGKGLHEVAWVNGRLPPLGTQLYTHADPGEVESIKAARDAFAQNAIDLKGEVERLRYKAELYDEVWELATGLGYMNVTTAISTLRARLGERDALLREALPALDLAATAFKSAKPVRAKIRAALASSAEPNAPASFIACHVDESCGQSTPVKRDERAVEPQEPSAPVEIDHDALVAAVCVLRSQGLGNLSAAVEEARAALERKP